MDNLTKAQVFSKIQSFLAELLGDDVMAFLDITMNSRFVQDLEMDSIQIVSFSEMVKREYQLGAELTEWLSKRSMKKMLNLTVGDIVTFIVDHQNK